MFISKSTGLTLDDLLLVNETENMFPCPVYVFTLSYFINIWCSVASNGFGVYVYPSNINSCLMFSYAYSTWRLNQFTYKAYIQQHVKFGTRIGARTQILLQKSIKLKNIAFWSHSILYWWILYAYKAAQSLFFF